MSFDDHILMLWSMCASRKLQTAEITRLWEYTSLRRQPQTRFTAEREEAADLPFP